MDEACSDINSPAMVTTQAAGSSGWLSLADLPPELLRRVCEYALPQGLTFSFRLCYENPELRSSWSLYVAGGSHTPVSVVIPVLPIDAQRVRLPKCRACPARPCRREASTRREVQIALLSVNKAIASEARAVLFTGNTFALLIDASPHRPVSLKSDLIFGPLGLPHRIHLIRDLRNIELEVGIDLDVDIDELNYYSAVRHRTRVQHFVDVIKQHAEDKNRNSFLKRLHVQIAFELDPSFYMAFGSLLTPATLRSLRSSMCERRMFALEPLVAIRRIEEFDVQGVPSWFKHCLEMHMRGEGGKLKKLEWPMRTKKRLKPRDRLKRPGKDTVSTWKSGMPMLDWLEFARRNGVGISSGTWITYPKRCISEQ